VAVVAAKGAVRTGDQSARVSAPTGNILRNFYCCAQNDQPNGFHFNSPFTCTRL